VDLLVASIRTDSTLGPPPPRFPQADYGKSSVAHVYAGPPEGCLLGKRVGRKGFVLDRTEREDGIRHLIDDFCKGHLTRRGFLAKAAALGLSAAVAAGMLGAPKVARRAGAQGSVTEIAPQQWEQGTGWGWVWGDDDEVGNLNELSPELALKALSPVERGQVYDLGLTYARDSFKFEGHNPGEVMSFHTSSGELSQEDLSMVTDEEENSTNTTFASSALFISDNVATQLDTLGHINEGDPPHAYNGFRAEEVQGDWGLQRLGAETVPPIVAPATMIDVARSVGQDPLPESYAIGQEEMETALDEQGVDIDQLDVVLVRTGTGGVGDTGAGQGRDHGLGSTLAGRGEGSPGRRYRHLGRRGAPAKRTARRRNELQPRPRLPSGAPGRAHPGVPEPRRPGLRRGL
jgi:hypothetical protein